MSHLPTLITDLALILASAGLMTLIFKRLKQPSVLGYIVAGILAGPHITLTPTVIDSGNIQTWADIGVVFLLFALGLEFSFKKLMKVGGPAIIAALTIIVGMVVLGFIVGVAMGWKQMDSIFLGGMLAMSSTSIIYKAFEDLGLRTQRFTGLVFGILVIEDLVAIVLMVMLSTMAVSKNFEGMEMVYRETLVLFAVVVPDRDLYYSYFFQAYPFADGRRDLADRLSRFVFPDGSVRYSRRFLFCFGGFRDGVYSGRDDRSGKD